MEREKKRGIRRAFFVFVFLFVSMVFFTFSALAVSVSLTAVNSTFATLSIDSATNIYAYEVNLDYSGVITEVNYNNFLSSLGSIISGNSEKSYILSVYESKADAGKTGVSGSGSLFNVSHSGSLSLRYALFIYNDSTKEYVYYNVSAQTSTITSSSAGGGAGGEPKQAKAKEEVKSLNLDVKEINLDMSFKDVRERIIKITNKGNKEETVEITHEGLEGIVAFDKTSFILRPGESKELKIIFVAPNMAGIKAGKIFIGGNPVLAVINTRTSPLLFDVSIVVPDSSKVIKVGNKLETQITLIPMGSEPRVDVTVNYVIKDFKGKVYLEESETFLVERQTSFKKQFYTSNLPEEDYLVGIEVVYPNGVATSSSHFKIAKEVPLNLRFIPLVLAGFILILISLIIIVAIKYKRHRKKVLRKK